MYEDDGRPNALLSQIPLTVSRFISLPPSPTLPYTYKPLPSTLPPSSTSSQTNGSSETLHMPPTAALIGTTPEEIIDRCRELKEYIGRVQDEASRSLQEWEQAVQEEELKEKRRLAPGWLDREERVLEPESARRRTELEMMLNEKNSRSNIRNTNNDERPGPSPQMRGLVDDGGRGDYGDNEDDGGGPGLLRQGDAHTHTAAAAAAAAAAAGDELDRAFGGGGALLAFRPK